MGNSQPEGFTSENLREFSVHYTFLKEQNDPRFGLIKVYKNKTSEEEVMIVSRLYPSEAEYTYFQKELTVRATFQHNNLLRLIGYQKEDSKSNLCGHSRAFEIYSEYHSHNLKKEIQKRAATNDFFTESELWYLAESCLSLGKFLEQKSIYHGDYRPINIMLTDDGYVKLPDNGILTPIKNNYYKTLAGECRCYLSPELMKAYSKKETNPKYNVYKADVFSLGMTLLYASNFVRPNTNCYEWSSSSINARSVQDHLKNLTTRYSPTWKTLLETMLRFDEESRPDFNGLYPLQFAQPQPQPQQPQPQPQPQPKPQQYVPTPYVPSNRSELRLIQSREVPAPQSEQTGQQIYQPQMYMTQPMAEFSGQSIIPQMYAAPQQMIPQPQQQIIYNSQQPIYNQQPQPQFYQNQQMPLMSRVVQQSSPRNQGPSVLPNNYAPSQGRPVNLQPNVGYQQNLVNSPQRQKQQVYETQYIGNSSQRPQQQVYYESQYIGNQNINNQGEDRNEKVKMAKAVNVVDNDEDQNDLDRRVKEALKATQETIERNMKMQSEYNKSNITE